MLPLGEAHPPYRGAYARLFDYRRNLVACAEEGGPDPEGWGAEGIGAGALLVGEHDLTIPA